MPFNFPYYIIGALLLPIALLQAQAAKQVSPNVVIVITDDQGYGDISAHGNPTLKTPSLDKLHAESLRLTDFHVSPFCTPTRGAIMTGHYPGRNGAFRTSSGRTMMHTDEITMAEVFAANGYATGLVGKWHLGDNAPHRPQDRGFQEVVWHKAGGVGQGPDFWGNDYFDDTYEVASTENKQGTLKKFKGYCTDVWFDEAMRFVERNQEKPFFLYLATNAPHGPYRVGQEWLAPYNKVRGKNLKEFFGMIANLDYNLGIFRARLQQLGLAENTIFIFMTDNGSARGTGVFNAGMKGGKSTIWDGGHRVPFFLHWPEGKLAKPQNVNAMTAHIDVLPTLAELCRLDLPESYEPDGVSFAKVLRKPRSPLKREPVVVQFHGGVGLADAIKPWNESVVLSGKWRLMNGEKLYDIRKDPSQSKDVAKQFPEVVERLKPAYLSWWESVSPRMQAVRIDLGNPSQNPTDLNSQDWYMPKGNPPWSQGAIGGMPKQTGPWMVDVKKAGEYRFTLRQRPKEAPAPLKAVRARIEIAGVSQETAVAPGAEYVTFTLNLPVGTAELITYLYDSNDQVRGAYYTEVEAL